MIQTNPLESLKWKNRVIVINSRSDKSITQVAKLLNNKRELGERDIILLHINDGEVKQLSDKPVPIKLNSKQLKDYLNLDKTFTIHLLGKDGGIKLKSDKVVSPLQIFMLIDGMPMRKAEMKRSHRTF